jgi:SAM-dependent methyltransferase
MQTENEYILGTHDAEISRLSIQHHLWRQRTLECWRRAGIERGATVLDVGAGPGFASLDLAQLVGPHGSVTSLDLSARFLGHLRAAAAQLGLANIRAIEADLERDDLPTESFDVIWCRWTLLFLRQPEKFVARLAQSLKAGGRIIFHEYSDYGAWRMVPDIPSFNRFVEAVTRSWRQSGGEPDAGILVPQWLESSGLRVLSAELIGYCIEPADPMWAWPMSYVETGTERLAQLGVISSAEAQQIRLDFASATGNPGTRTVTPTVVQIIGGRL